MKLRDLNWILARSLTYSILPWQDSSVPCSISRLSSNAASHGAIFSSSVPGRKPISSAMGGVERATINLLYFFCSRIAWSP